MATRPNWDIFNYSNGYETGTSTGSSPGCTNGCGDGTFEGCNTGCTKQCPGCDGDWCCDCNGCRPGKCDDKPANKWCQDFFDTFGRIAGGCPFPNTDLCYVIDSLTNTLIPNTDKCGCPGFVMPKGFSCDPITRDPVPLPPSFPPSYPKDRNEEDDGPKTSPKTPVSTETICYLKSVEVFGDYGWHRVRCYCRALGTPEAVRRCIFGEEEGPGIVGCDCGSMQINGGPITVTCGETIDGKYTGRECDPVECNCDSDCDQGQTCNNYGSCV